jgi:hypothetical protein
MRTAQQLHQRQRDAGDEASGNFAKEGKSARRLCQEVNLLRTATLPRFAQDGNFAQEGNVAEEGGSIATVEMDRR